MTDQRNSDDDDDKTKSRTMEAQRRISADVRMHVCVFVVLCIRVCLGIKDGHWPARRNYVCVCVYFEIPLYTNEQYVYTERWRGPTAWRGVDDAAGAAAAVHGAYLQRANCSSSAQLYQLCINDGITYTHTMNGTCARGASVARNPSECASRASSNI